MGMFDGIRKSVLTDGEQFWHELTMPFFGFKRPSVTKSQGKRDTFQLLVYAVRPPRGLRTYPAVFRDRLFGRYEENDHSDIANTL